MGTVTAIVRFQIITILAGLSLDKAITKIASDTASLFVVLCLVYLIINLLNFYHAKIVTTEDTEYKSEQLKHPITDMLDFLLNILLMGSFLFIPLYVDNFTHFLLANMIMRILDLLLIVHSHFSILRSDRGREILRAHVYWAIYNVATLCLLGFLLLLVTICQFPLALWMPTALVASAILDIAIDYYLNWNFYFPTSRRTEATAVSKPHG